MDSVKRKRVFTWLKEKSYDLILLQEVHCNDKTKTMWETEWESKAFFSGSQSNSAGVCILLANNLKHADVQFFEIVVGRLIAIEIVINEKTYIIINIWPKQR